MSFIPFKKVQVFLKFISGSISLKELISIMIKLNMKFFKSLNKSLYSSYILDITSNLKFSNFAFLFT